MRHWHRCKRWWGEGLDCPFGGMEGHEVDEDEPPDDLPDRIDLLLAAEKGAEADVLQSRQVEPGQMPLPFPFPIPQPERVPQLPGMPPFRPPRPAPADPPRPLPGQPALPDPEQLPLVPAAVQHVGEGGLNLVGGALGMVPQDWRATNAQVSALYGAFASRTDDPPLQGRYSRIAVAEEGAARIAGKQNRVNKRRLALAAAAAVAGAGLGFGVHRASTGGFGGLQVNMAAEMERLTSAVGVRKLEDKGVGQFPAGKGGSEGGV